MSASPSPTRLPLYLAILYGLAIVYASVSPFRNWMAPLPNVPFFLFAPWPPKWVRYDISVNVLAYLPFGFFVALIPRRHTTLVMFAAAIGVGMSMSFAMESLQAYMPARDSSIGDFVSNSAGVAIGALLAIAFARSPGAWRSMGSIRDRWFLHGAVGDAGLALLAIWLFVQSNPGIPLFATMYDLATQPGGNPPSDFAAAFVEAAHSSFQLLGVGLFLALLLRERYYVAGAMLLLIGAAALIKGIAAALLLRPTAWEHWLAAPVAVGVAVGTLLLSMAIWLPRPAQVTLAAIALLSSLLATIFAPDLLSARAPISLFNGPYGHLLNFNGLTHTVLLLWPALASMHLFALAGSADWGKPT